MLNYKMFGIGMGMVNKTNIYIKKARKKRLLKRIIILIVFIIIGGIIFATKTNYFLINSIELEGDHLVTGEYVQSNTENLNGNNIFFIKKNDIMKKLRENPYIDTVKITKKLPKTLKINVTEKKGLFYVLEGKRYNILSSELVLLETVDNIEGKKLIELKGLSVGDKALGEKIEGNHRIEKLLNLMYNMQDKMENDNKGVYITALDVGDMSRIKAYFGEIEILLGNDENITKKMSDAMKIYLEFSPKKYIIVNFNGSPDFQ